MTKLNGVYNGRAFALRMDDEADGNHLIVQVRRELQIDENPRRLRVLNLFDAEAEAYPSEDAAAAAPGSKISYITPLVDVFAAVPGAEGKAAAVCVHFRLEPITYEYVEPDTSGMEPQKAHVTRVNGVIERITKGSKGDKKRARADPSAAESIAYSSLVWNDVSSIYTPLLKRQKIERTTITDTTVLDRIVANIETQVKVRGEPDIGSERKKGFFISEIVTGVASLFDDVTIEDDGSIVPTVINARGKGDMVIKRCVGAEYRYICIVEFKKNDLEQGMAQCLAMVDAEWEANMQRKAPVAHIYGIVCDFCKWKFFKRTADAIESHRDHIDIGDSLKADVERIAETVYTMLSTA